MPVMDMAQQQSTEDEALDLVVEQGRDHQEHPIGQNDGISAARQKSPEQQQKCTPEKLQKTENSEPHTTLSEVEKRLVIVIASFAAFISPISASIYYPALDPLASDLGVTPSTINLTITAYMIFQALAPTIIGNISDTHGRRPAYLICFIIYIGANIGLALQSNYAALLVLRCLQSSGSSGTIALGSAVVSDTVTRAERGKYVGYAFMGVALGPALGPTIGGLLTQFLGWRSIFWFLTVVAVVMLVIVVCFLPETCRSIVGNGSIPPQPWNISLLSYLRQRKLQEARVGPVAEAQLRTLARRRRRPNPLEALSIATEKETGMIILTSALLYAGFFSVLSSLPSQLQAKFNFNSLRIGLCYLPYGLGGFSARWTVGPIMDWNFRRHARRLGMEIVKNRQQKISDFPLEVARLQITLPFLYAACAAIVTYSWVMEFRTNLAGPLIALFFLGLTVTGATNSLNTLVVDCHQQRPATATAANNLFRCLFGAGAVAVAVPMIDRIGVGWTGTFVAGLWIVFSPGLWAVKRWGQGWREEKRSNEKFGEAEGVSITRVVDHEAHDDEK